MIISNDLILRRLFGGWTAFNRLLCQGVSLTVLACFYLLILTPMALLFRLMGRDALRRRRRERVTYWTARPSAGDLRSYFRSC
jgi:hypothetical protein